MISPYTGPILVGGEFMWEPTKPSSRVRVRITQVVGHILGMDRQICCVILSRAVGIDMGEYVWNDESRFREACVPYRHISSDTPPPQPVPLHGGADMRCQAFTDAVLELIHERGKGLPMPMILGCLRLIEHQLISEAV